MPKISEVKTSYSLFDLLELNEELVRKYEPYIKQALDIIKYKNKEAKSNKA
ncbi:hypothetical protein [Campylobacter sp. RM16192]|uniref:hypothetical protein n=1 Tax=Campylobacter sp. RM16192 TaxID=1660080 RepID=UPI00163A149B|nr:hypothetical protein [Campylobacter sp. RM16192]